MLAELKHPNIVGLHEAGLEGFDGYGHDSGHSSQVALSSLLPSSSRALTAVIGVAIVVSLTEGVP